MGVLDTLKQKSLKDLRACVESFTSDIQSMQESDIHLYELVINLQDRMKAAEELVPILADTAKSQKKQIEVLLKAVKAIGDNQEAFCDRFEEVDDLVTELCKREGARDPKPTQPLARKKEMKN